ncbi:hypothetical protein H2201_000010 [Coniosporium apollinis]|uniref:Phospholipase/carboxylesterase/thioesterase domain-containing protein n=1 Tax=Coniosporium apollinis TaxID=61459 RepID=A0ABQ9P5I5_9PEZI|nr:hypothetical protein H2201_000010 [Coniosporium apollinis]
MSLPPLKDPGHPYAKTSHISFTFHTQTPTSTPFGYDYFLSLPPSYDADPTKQWPLVLFLHGAGESQRGPNESYATLRHGVPKIILCYDRLKDGKEPSIEIPLAARLRGRNPNKGRGREDADKSVVPVPKEVCDIVAEEFITVTPSLDMDNGYGWNAHTLSALLDELLPLLRADPSRLHVTGFSMGGYGTWSLGLHSPDRFASLVPICGGGDSILAKNIKHIPQWVHHGELDDIIPISQSVKMASALERAQRGLEGVEKVRFTRWEGLAHDCWTEAYNEVELWRWMLEKRRAE